MPSSNKIPPSPRLFVFDLDGTLVDSQKDLLAGAQAVLAHFGRPAIPPEVLFEYVSHGVQTVFRIAFGDGETFREAMALYVRHYSAHSVAKTLPYPDLEKTLDLLSFAKLTILTNKPSELLRGILAHLGIASRFEIVLGMDDIPAEKPSPSGIEMILKKLDLKPADAVMVGDSKGDIVAGKNAGTYTVGCAYGFRPRSDLVRAGADLIIDRLSDLAKYFGPDGS
jgi:phosphoglycolate phosphatase